MTDKGAVPPNSSAVVSLEQINLMKHCIGYEKRHVKRGKYESYRNYFNNGDEKDSDWEHLVQLGFAKQYTRFDQIIYSLTEKGGSFLESVLEVKITEGR